MAKKNRKTKKQKAAVKKHEFNPWGTIKPSDSTRDDKSGKAAEDKNKPQVASYIYKDLQKISTLMAVFLIAVVLVAIISYYTDLLNPVFSILGISY